MNQDYLDELEIRQKFGADEIKPPLDTHDIQSYVHTILQNPALDKIKISAPDFNAAQAETIIAALRHCDSLQTISLWGVEDKEVVRLFAEAAKEIPSLEEFEVYRCPMGDAEAEVIATSFKDHPSLNRLCTKNTEMSFDGMRKLIDILPTLPNLAAAELHESDGGPAAIEEAMETVLFDNPNIHMAMPETIALDQRVMQNTQRFGNMQNAAHQMQKDGKPFTGGLLAEYMALRPAAMHRARTLKPNFGALNDALCHALTLAPEVSVGDALSPEWLFKANKTGYAPFDFPAIWNALPEISAQLKANGTPLTKEMLLREDRVGESYLSIGIKNRCMNEIVDALASNNERITRDDIMKDGALNPLGTLIVEAGQTESLFKSENWMGQSPHHARSLFEALPDDVKSQISNLHQLTATLSRQRRLESRGLLP